MPAGCRVDSGRGRDRGQQTETGRDTQPAQGTGPAASSSLAQPALAAVWPQLVSAQLQDWTSTRLQRGEEGERPRHGQTDADRTLGPGPAQIHWRYSQPVQGTG